MTQAQTTAIAIVIGFALVAGAVVVSGNNPAASYFGPQTAAADETPERPGKHRFIYGDPNAETTIVEFSDYECPFCARVHPTLKRIVDESAGTINWEYRHLPLTIHPNAVPAAIAAECVGRLAGNEAFWQFSDTLFANQSALSKDLYQTEATALGINEVAFADCLAEEKIAQQVEIDSLTAEAFGGSGTPFSLIIAPDGTRTPVRGALPYENWQALLK